MKRVGSMLSMFGLVALFLTACQGRTPTTPSGNDGLSQPASGSSGGTTTTPVNGVNDESSSDDEIRARLTASPTTIEAGQYSTLTWTTDEAEDVYLNGVSVEKSGSKNVYPSATTTYTLVAKHDDHQATSSVTVTVSGGSSDDEVRAQLTASPTTIQAGQYSTLTWTTDEAEDVYLNGVSVEKSGSKNVYPSATTTYTLVAKHDDHQATSSATVTVSGTAPAPVPTATFTLTPTSIQSGQSCTLTWNTTNATSVTLNGNGVALNGTQSFSPSSTTTYTLVATNDAGSTTKTATVTVSAVPPTVPMPTASLTATPATIDAGQSSSLAWNTTDATSVTLNGSAVAVSGTRSYSPTTTTTYTLVASNSTGSITKTATVTVNAVQLPPMPTASLTASPSSILSGGSSALSWNTTDAATVTLNGATVGATGMQTVSPTSTTTYTLVARNAAGSVTKAATVTVSAPVPRPTASLTASPSSIMSGQSSTLSWVTTDAATVTLNGATVPATGMQVMVPTATTTYTLVASNSSGSVTSTATVTVTAPAPAITYLTNATTGQPSIKQIMDGNCIMCHGGSQPTAGRDFSTYQGVMSVVTSGDPNSRLIQMTKPGAPMHFYLQPDSAGRAQIIYDWIVLYGAKQQ